MIGQARAILAVTSFVLVASCGGGGATGSGSSASGSGGATTSSGSSGSATSGAGGAASSAVSATSGAGGGMCGSTSYDQVILCDHPVAYWAMNKAPGNEPDLTGNGNTGTYKGGAPATASLPNNDMAADFNGSSQYLTIPSHPSMSIPTTGELTWEGWIRPDVLQFPHDDGSSGYVDWMGKCEEYAPTCEWEARMYDTNTNENPNRCNRLSAYVFNPGAGLGSGADWQPVCGLLQAGQWLHVVGEYTTLTQPADCPQAPSTPGSIDIWVNGVKWNQSKHSPTGCMSQYNVAPKANSSAVNIGTMAFEGWFAGAIGKVAIYDHLLTPAQITNHYQVMTGKSPTGSCADTCSL